MTVIPFAGLSAVGMVYLVAQGKAADQAARWVVGHADPDATDPGAIASHSGQYFPADRPTRPRFAVTTEPGPAEVLHEEPMTVFGRRVRTYYVVRVRAEPSI